MRRNRLQPTQLKAFVIALVVKNCILFPLAGSSLEVVKQGDLVAAVNLTTLPETLANDLSA